MPKRFLTKLAGGVALGSAALLLGAPAVALAATDGPTKESGDSNQQREWKRESANDRQGNGQQGNGQQGNGQQGNGQQGSDKENKKPKTFALRDKDGNEVVCATNDQNAEAGVAQTFNNNSINGVINIFPLIGAAAAANVNAQALVVCIRDLNLDVDVEVELLSGILETAELARAAGALPGAPAVSTPGVPGVTAVPGVAGVPGLTGIPGLGGVYAGPNGAWVLPANGSVAAGEGGAVARTDTGTLAATGAGMMGVAALGGIGLLRRRSADGTVA